MGPMDAKAHARLERNLVVLEQSLAAAVHLPPVDLAADVCRLLVEVAKLEMAWVGRVDPRSGVVRPIATAGDAEGYLAALTTTAHKGSHGDGPTGRCIRERRSAVSEDIAVDPRMEPWRSPALARGYRSSAAVPVAGGEEGPVVLCAYSGEPGYFTPSTLRWLEAVANVISVRIGAQQKTGAAR